MNTSPEALLISISKILFDGIGLLLILKLNSNELLLLFKTQIPPFDPIHFLFDSSIAIEFIFSFSKNLYPSIIKSFAFD